MKACKQKWLVTMLAWGSAIDRPITGGARPTRASGRRGVSSPHRMTRPGNGMGMGTRCPMPCIQVAVRDGKECGVKRPCFVARPYARPAGSLPPWTTLTCRQRLPRRRTVSGRWVARFLMQRIPSLHLIDLLHESPCRGRVSDRLELEHQSNKSRPEAGADGSGNEQATHDGRRTRSARTLKRHHSNLSYYPMGLGPMWTQ